jgi:hypothetical protein
MAGTIALVVFLPALAVAALVVWRRPAVALYAFVVGLAAHNLVMALLYDAGVRGGPLTIVAAWKEALLAVALASVTVRAPGLPFRPGPVDALAAAFAALVLLYALIPQSALGGAAGAEAVLHAVRHALLPVAAYFLGRSLALDLRRLAWTIVGTAAAAAAIGLVDLLLVPVESWRDSGAVGWYREQLGFEYHGPGGLPENFAFNSDDGVFRRLVSTFISPLASAFLFAAALLLAAAGRRALGRPRLLAALSALVSVGLLYTLSRSTFLALAGGFVVLAVACRRAWPVAAGAAVLAAGAAFGAVFTSVAPETHFFPEDLPYQIEQARKRGDVPEGTVLDPGEPSIRSHLDSLRAGIDTIAEQPQGYGLGNAGAVARRFDTRLRAGESNYTEIGVETGLAGLLLFVAWNAALLVALLRRHGWAAAGVAAVLATVLALGVQTDAVGVPWLAFCVWVLAGSLLAERVAHGAEQVVHVDRLREEGDGARGERPIPAR